MTDRDHDVRREQWTEQRYPSDRAPENQGDGRHHADEDLQRAPGLPRSRRVRPGYPYGAGMTGPPTGAAVDRLIELRERAGRESPKGRLLKVTANTIYGAFASPHLDTGSPVTANVITGTARALAFAMANALNAHNAITDGVVYRRDQIPAGTFAECLRRQPDYPVRRAEGGVRFLDPTAVPDDDRRFSDWYVAHATRFFGVAGRAAYEELFRFHRLVHKPLQGGQAAFDALITDGAANYGKLVADGTEVRVAEFKARSFRERAKKTLGRWLARVYRTDRFEAPPPAVPSARLLSARDALRQAEIATALAGSTGAAIVPLGYEYPGLATYKVFKPSAYLFRSARQRRKILADWRRLNRATEAGPELLALRRTFRGSLSEVAAALYQLIRGGGERLSGLNVDRLCRPGTAGRRRGEEIGRKREKKRRAFVVKLAVSPRDAPLTGLVVSRSSVAAVSATVAV